VALEDQQMRQGIAIFTRHVKLLGEVPPLSVIFRMLDQVGLDFLKFSHNS